MEQLKRVEKSPLKERVVQFGEGNFLRGFVDWMFDKLNKEAGGDFGVVIVQPLPVGRCADLNEQGGLYTLCLHGNQDGEAVEETTVVESVLRCINPFEDWDAYMALASNPDLRFIVSNTTEAGIEYLEGQETYPSRLTRFLKARYEAGLPGFVILPCELIDYNGTNLKKCVLQYAKDWHCDAEFIRWIEQDNIFTNTLVDRIITGYPKDNFAEMEASYGYHDTCLDTGEIFHLWVIEGPKSLAQELPFAELGLHVLFVDDVTPYKQRKVRILNGAHTMMVLAAYLCGHETVYQAMHDETVRAYMEKGIYEEIIPTLDLPKEELESFAKDVTLRFDNPYIKHYLLSIALNSVSKWKVRVLPSVLEYEKRFGKAPARLVFSLAALIEFYREGKPNDATDIMDFMKVADVHAILAREDYWGQDLTRFESAIDTYLQQIKTLGIHSVMEQLV